MYRYFDRYQLFVPVTLILFIFAVSKMSENQTEQPKFVNIHFEVFGRVQGVFFRKHTQKRASALGLGGYCMNTEKGTVTGVMEGNVEKVEIMKKWLREVGSPSSRIDKAEFTKEISIPRQYEKEFIVRL
ncbi:PREDICTED: acylphosphatase-2-like [Nicrophorus vespilloides]|uniref:Acylphosphatase n=1 Tax=Nicrophorus vespilloides TaxID=110193 RepID=A0ABM1NBH6_NICVS|nr:PREDICTED: acylphosphatase-2-like [Nicrophorus vespilloides]